MIKDSFGRRIFEGFFWLDWEMWMMNEDKYRLFFIISSVLYGYFRGNKNINFSKC